MRYFKTPQFAVALPLCLLVVPVHAQAQQEVADIPERPSTQIRTEFTADYFEAFAPRTALDMLAQVPGFTIESGDTSKRGLGQGGANVLIGGERLTGKADVFDELRQILAANVVSVRIRDGAALNIPGLTGRIADIEVRPAAFSGSWEWEPRFSDLRQPLWNNGRINISGVRGDLDWSAFARDFSFRGGADGVEVRTSPDDAFLERRESKIRNIGDRPGFGGKLTWTPREGHIGNLNGEYSIFNFNRSSDETRLDADAAATVLTRSDFFEDETLWELGVDYALPLAGGTFKLTGFAERESSPTQSTFALFDPKTGFTGASRFTQAADEAETILRGEYSWAPSARPGRSWQIGLEGAFNALEVEQVFETRGPGEIFSGGETNLFDVSEDRYEATLTHSRPFGPEWDVQASIGVEQSELSQVRDGTADVDRRSFVRPKGFVAATFKPRDDLKIRTRVEREVGQLNFFDFIASVDLVDDLGRSANADLVPAQSWLGSVELDRDFGSGNTVRIKLFGAAISDIVDRIPVGLDGDAVGNLDSATRWGVESAVSLRGAAWGWTGTQLDAELTWRDSTLDDPLLGFARPISGETRLSWEVSYRHDIADTDWVYGAFLEGFENRDRVRTFSINRFGVSKPFSSVFVEHKDVRLFGTTLAARVSLQNVLGGEELFRRRVFDGRRDRGLPLRDEDARFAFGQTLELSFSGEF